MIDIIIIFDSLRKDVGDIVIPNLLQNRYIKFEKCFTHCGWTPYALSHIFSGAQPKQDHVLSLNTSPKNAYVWRKKRKLDTDSLKFNYVNLYDTSFFGLFEWNSLSMLQNFYKIKSKGVKAASYNRLIDKKGAITYPFNRSLNDINTYIDDIKNKEGNHLLFVRAMSTHAPYYGDNGVLSKIQLLNYKNNLTDTKIDSKIRQELHTLYKTLIYEDYIINGNESLKLQQAEGLKLDFKKIVEPIINKLSLSKEKFRLILMADHGEIFTKYFHLQGHAHYFNKDISNVPFFYTSSDLRRNYVVNNEVFLSDILPILTKFKSNELDEDYMWRQIKHKEFQFHCKDDFLFESISASDNLYKLTSNYKNIHEKVRIKTDLSLTIDNKNSNDIYKYLNDRFVINSEHALRISSESYVKYLNTLKRGLYAKDFITYYKQKTG